MSRVFPVPPRRRTFAARVCQVCRAFVPRACRACRAASRRLRPGAAGQPGAAPVPHVPRARTEVPA